jgi:predicted alpha/beta superfamily hydrolase
LAGAGVVAQSTVHFQVKSLPVYHPAGSDLFLAGSFNGWNPKDENFKFQHQADGSYTLAARLENKHYEFKVTRGGWDKTECLAGGAARENRQLTVSPGQTISLDIEEWSDRFPSAPGKSTVSGNVTIIDTAFLIPHLKRTRRIWVYLPPCYHTCTRRFPVIYMHDGQNLFDDATSYSGEWGVDEFLDSLGSHDAPAIIVGIDHGETKRLNEYNPYDFSLNDYEGGTVHRGEGNEYVDFIVKTLKPHIDKTFRTARNKANTAIAGSSMGGLISLYAVLKYPRVFGAAGVFSPAFWVAPRILDDIGRKGRKVKSKIYFYAGKQEGAAMVPGMLKAYEAMRAVSRSKMQAVIRDEGKHNEATWRKEFPLFYHWLARP